MKVSAVVEFTERIGIGIETTEEGRESIGSVLSVASIRPAKRDYSATAKETPAVVEFTERKGIGIETTEEEKLNKESYFV